jgi:hypothetical protein
MFLRQISQEEALQLHGLPENVDGFLLWYWLLMTAGWLGQEHFFDPIYPKPPPPAHHITCLKLSARCDLHTHTASSRMRVRFLSSTWLS